MTLRTILMTCAALGLAACQPGPGDASGEAETEGLVDLWRLDCGTIQVNDLNLFSDEDAYTGETRTLVDSCYLIRHADEYLLWDAGLPTSLLGHEMDEAAPMDATVTVSIADQLAELGLAPDDIGRVAISHYHFDHIGQLPDFPNATLLIGDGDWAALTGEAERDDTVDPAPFAHWLEGGGLAEPVNGDFDVFGDGSVVMMSTPGHTPGHHSLIVRFTDRDPVMLTGDLAHFRENYENAGVPDFNSDHDQTVASLQAFKQRAADIGATVIIQHEAGDVGKLPYFPEAAY
jgi:glyoxylase-like metal-dependent hydrolase (beta-lactamase superfamily II)